MNEILNAVFLQRPIRTWLLSAGIALGGILTAWIFRWIAVAVIAKRDNREGGDVGDSCAPKKSGIATHQGFVFPILIIAGFYAATTVLDLDGSTGRIISSIFMVLVSLVMIRFFVVGINMLFNKAAEGDQDGRLFRYRPLRSILVISVWIVGTLFLLANLGFDITTIVAGLGIGGIAVASCRSGVARRFVQLLCHSVRQAVRAGGFPHYRGHPRFGREDRNQDNTASVHQR
jgi:small-conductance mechanosensitive channel